MFHEELSPIRKTGVVLNLTHLPKKIGSSSVTTYGMTPYNTLPLIQGAEWIWNANKSLRTVDCEASLDSKLSDGKLKVTVADELLQVTINGVVQDMTKFKNKINGRLLSSVDLSLRQGDVVALVGQNYGTFSAGNPGYMNVEIFYPDKNNVQQRIVSDTEKWRCYPYNLSTMKREVGKFTCSFGLRPSGSLALMNGAQ